MGPGGVEIMLEFVFIGRGGQGVVFAEEILSKALFYQGFQVKSFPAFGTERRGAPVRAFLRVSTDLVRESFQIYHPDYYIIFDPCQLTGSHLEAGGLVNSVKSFKNPDMINLDASHIALNNKLGTETNPIINTTMLGGIAALLEQLEFKNLQKALVEKLPKRFQERNIQAAWEAYQEISSRTKAAHWSLRCA